MLWREGVNIHSLLPLVQVCVQLCVQAQDCCVMNSMLQGHVSRYEPAEGGKRGPIAIPCYPLCIQLCVQAQDRCAKNSMLQGWLCRDPA